jgi:hypothetical protein
MTTNSQLKVHLHGGNPFTWWDVRYLSYLGGDELGSDLWLFPLCMSLVLCSGRGKMLTRKSPGATSVRLPTVSGLVVPQLIICIATS